MTQPAMPARLLPPVGLLALCPLLAAADTLLTAACVALLFLVLLFLVTSTMSALGRGVAPELRILMLVLISGIWVTLLDLALQAYAYRLSAALGMYVPLLAVNSLLLTLGEHSLRCGSARFGAQSGFIYGAWAALWIVPLGVVREILGTGALLSDSQILPGLPGPWVITSFPVPALQDAPGTLLVLALAAAWVMGRRPARD